MDDELRYQPPASFDCCPPPRASSGSVDSRKTVAALGLAGVAAGAPVALAPLSLTGNLGLNVSMDVLNLSTTGILKVHGETASAKLIGFHGKIAAAAAHAGAGLVSALANAGLVPHPPLTVSREPLAPILKQLGGHLKEGSELEWQTPY